MILVRDVSDVFSSTITRILSCCWRTISQSASYSQYQSASEMMFTSCSLDSYEKVSSFCEGVTLLFSQKLIFEQLASNAREGWGAVTNEALEEGMYVMGTYEAGSSATLLNDKALFHAGDWKRLLVLLENCLDQKRRGVLKGQGIGEWSVEKGAHHLVSFINEVKESRDGCPSPGN